MCAAYTAIGELPACVSACPQRVLEWDDIDELVAKHPQAVKDLPILPDSTMTNPSTIITPRAAASETNFRQKII
jgi:anaerobic dimethyl sulfoxide reductase subunit B (iron-sulfur subunit)